MAALGAAAVLVVLRVLVVDASGRVPNGLAVPAFGLAGVGVICGMWTLVSQGQDPGQVRHDWKGRSRQDRREALASLRAEQPVSVDLLGPAVRFARLRAMSSRVGGWVALMSIGTVVTSRLYPWSLILAVGVFALGAASWRLRLRWVEQYRTVRAQVDTAVA